MPKASQEKRWALLPHTDLPDASMRDKLLGAIVQDFQDPQRNFVAAPKDSVSVVMPVEDTDFNTFLSTIESGKIWSRVGSIFKTAFGEDSTTKERRKSQKVRSYGLHNEEKTFNVSKEANIAEIQEMIKNNAGGHGGVVYMVVGIKTCIDGQFWSDSSSSSHKEGKLEIPTDEISTSLTGIRPPIDANLGVSGSRDAGEGQEGYLVAKGERIFAVKYRMIKTRRDWKITPAPKSKSELNIGGYYKPKNNLAFGADTVDEQVRMGEQEEPVSDDTLVLGDELYSWGIESPGGERTVLFMDMV
jgi:hypothetical protein